MVDSGRAGLRGTGVARVTVWRWEAVVVVVVDFAASFGVTGAVRFARVGIWGCWREEGAMGTDRSYGILAEEAVEDEAS